METVEGWRLVVLGGMLLCGFLAHVSGPLIHVPRVTLLVLIGVALGPHMLGVVPSEVNAWFPFVTHLALALIGFLLGEEFRWKDLRKRGRRVLGLSIGEAGGAALLVGAAVYLVTFDPVLAVILAGIAPPTAPAATVETLREGRAEGELTDTVLGVVAIDDAWGVIVFSLLIVIASALAGEGLATGPLLDGLREILGGIALGAALGVPMAWISNRVRGGDITLVEAGGIIFFQTGLAVMLDVSYLLAAIVLGAVVVNLSRREHLFKEIEHVREPFMAIFFILAGLELDVRQLASVGLLGVVYVLARAGGGVVGGRISGSLLNTSREVRRRIGWCLLPQAGVALGFALIVQERMPDYGEQVLTLVIATTVVFEITGPLFTRYHIERAGEWGVGAQEEDESA